MNDKTGIATQIVMRDGVTKEMVKAVFESRQEFIALALAAGWAAPDKAKPSAMPAKTNGASKPTQAAARPGQSQKPQGATLTFPAADLVGTVDGGKQYWKVKGGRFTQYGVTVWPEVLEASGFDDLEPGGIYPLTGYTAHYTTKEDGKPEKIVALVEDETF